MTRWLCECVVFLILLKVFWDWNKKQIKNMQMELNRYQLQEKSMQYQCRKNHEFKNHINCIYFLLEMKKFEELKKYVGNIRENMYCFAGGYIATNHIIIDAILNTKYQEAIKKGISFELESDDLADFRINDEDIVIIMSNLLDNAMEACEKCVGDKYMVLKIEKNKYMIQILLRNSHSNQISYQEGELATTKEDSLMEHGFGLVNVKEGLARCGGWCDISYTEQEFMVVAKIPNKSFDT